MFWKTQKLSKLSELFGRAGRRTSAAHAEEVLGAHTDPVMCCAGIISATPRHCEQARDRVREEPDLAGGARRTARIRVV